MGTCVSSFFVGIRCAIGRGKPLVGEKGLGYGALRGREQIAYSSPSKNTSSSGCWLWISCTFARTTVRESGGSSRSKRTWILFATASAPRAGRIMGGPYKYAPRFPSRKLGRAHRREACANHYIREPPYKRMRGPKRSAGCRSQGCN